MPFRVLVKAGGGRILRFILFGFCFVGPPGEEAGRPSGMGDIFFFGGLAAVGWIYLCARCLFAAAGTISKNATYIYCLSLGRVHNPGGGFLRYL